MNFDDLQSSWEKQTSPKIDPSLCSQRSKNDQRNTRLGLLFLLAILASACFTLWTQVNRAMADNAYTFANSYLDLAFTLTGIVLILRGIAYTLRMRRELNSVNQNTVSYIDVLIRGNRDDVRAIRWHLPLMLGGIALFGVISRLQLVRDGVTFNDSWSELIFANLALIITYLGFLYRLHSHTLPKLKTLEETRRELLQSR